MSSRIVAAIDPPTTGEKLMTHLELSFDSGDESLSVRTFLVEEGLNTLFSISITARSSDADLDLEGFVGQEAAFYLVGGIGRERSWTGICSRMEQVRVEQEGLSTYEFTIVPTLWFLTQRRNHRVFQHQSIPDILAKLLAEWGIAPIWQIDREIYPSLELRIQYGESDYDFLSRLVEEAGITFFFVDDLEQRSRVVFNDRPQGAEPRLERLPFVDAPEGSQAGRLEYVTAVRVSDRVCPGKHVVRDFDFRRPAHRLLADANAGAGGLDAMLEQYHYLPGAALAETGQAEGTPVGDDRGAGRHADATGQGLAQRSLHSHRALKRGVSFQTNAFDLTPGVVFFLDNHPRSDLAADKALLLAHARFEGTVGEEWTLSAKALFADQPYYPGHVTAKPRIDGVQSAIVVGPDGQEIHTDEYGRVRVQFHWDREGEYNEESFVWVRVSQGWAGGGYGMLSLPRVGHEVLVQFMDGDPDSPLIVGRAFNASTTVPYALPEHKTVSTWRSASSPGADGFNEIKMEDKKGQELLYLQAEKDHAKLVKNDEVSLIGNDRTKLVEHDEMSSIKNDRVKVVQHDERVSVQNDRTGLVGNDEHLAVGRDRVAQIKKNETLAVGANHATQAGKSASLAVGESRAAHIGKSDQVSVGDSQSVTVGQSRSSTVGVNQSTLVGSQYSVTIGNGLGGQLARLLGGAIDGGLLGSLGSIASPLMAGPMQQVMGALKKGPFGDTPLTTFIQGPMATLESVLPGKLKQVVSMIPGARSLLFGPGKTPTSFTMVDKKITLTTGDATIQLEGGRITILGKDSISAQAGQMIDLKSELVLQAQANALVKIQAGPTPVLKADGRPVKTLKEPVGDLVLVGMNRVEAGAKELMVLGSKKEMVVVAAQTLDALGNQGATVVSASGNIIIQGQKVQLNPPAGPAASDVISGGEGNDDLASGSGSDTLGEGEGENAATGAFRPPPAGDQYANAAVLAPVGSAELAAAQRALSLAWTSASEVSGGALRFGIKSAGGVGRFVGGGILRVGSVTTGVAGALIENLVFPDAAGDPDEAKNVARLEAIRRGVSGANPGSPAVSTPATKEPATTSSGGASASPRRSEAMPSVRVDVTPTAAAAKPRMSTVFLPIDFQLSGREFFGSSAMSGTGRLEAQQVGTATLFGNKVDVFSKDGVQFITTSDGVYVRPGASGNFQPLAQLTAVKINPSEQTLIPEARSRGNGTVLGKPLYTGKLDGNPVTVYQLTDGSVIAHGDYDGKNFVVGKNDNQFYAADIPIALQQKLRNDGINPRYVVSKGIATYGGVPGVRYNLSSGESVWAGTDGKTVLITPRTGTTMLDPDQIRRDIKAPASQPLALGGSAEFRNRTGFMLASGGQSYWVDEKTQAVFIKNKAGQLVPVNAFVDDRPPTRTEIERLRSPGSAAEDQVPVPNPREDTLPPKPTPSLELPDRTTFPGGSNDAPPSHTGAPRDPSVDALGVLAFPIRGRNESFGEGQQTPITLGGTPAEQPTESAPVVAPAGAGTDSVPPVITGPNTTNPQEDASVSVNPGGSMVNCGHCVLGDLTGRTADGVEAITGYPQTATTVVDMGDMIRQLGIKLDRAPEAFRGVHAVDEAFAAMLRNIDTTSDYIVGVVREGAPGHWLRMTRTPDGSYMPRDPQSGKVGVDAVELPDMSPHPSNGVIIIPVAP